MARLRLETYVAVMNEAGLEPRIERTDMTEEGGYRAGVRLLAHAEPPTAVFAVNDISAIGMLSGRRRTQSGCPPSSFHWSGTTTHTSPGSGTIGSTTVDNASHEVGRRAAHALLRRIETPNREAAIELIPPHLQVRGSSGPV